MGKKRSELPIQQQEQEINSNNNDNQCATCLNTIGGVASIKCVVMLIISLAVLISTVFWVFPNNTVHVLSKYDVSQDIKQQAIVQAMFKLQKPVEALVPYIDRLVYDINDEIAVPSTKVVILSMHQSGITNWTNVVFGILPDPINSTINTVSLSLVRSALVDLFLQQSNLSLTATFFGHPASFEILKFPGGITVLPEQTAFHSLDTENYFRFVLNNSICDIKQHLTLLKEEMRLWLRLRPYEDVFVQVTNKNGSTTEEPVKVKAGVISDMGLILPHRLKQLAQRITRTSHSTNLGLNNTVFGKVKEIRLSSVLDHTLHSTSPTTSPSPSPSPSPSLSLAPSPAKNDDLSPSYPSAPSPSGHAPHCGSMISPSPSPSLDVGSSASLPPSVGLSPSPLAFPLISSSSSSFGGSVSFHGIWVCLCGLMTMYLILWW